MTGSFEDDEKKIRKQTKFNIIAEKSKKKKKKKKEKTDTDATTISLPTPIKRILKWWERPPIKYAFCHPQIRTKLEKLMGSNLVNLTDREYMMYLQQRILLDYAVCMNKRIALRQAEEMERVKGLVLTGKIPLSQAPPEMAKHPVMLIDEYCRNVLAERRAKIKILKANIPKHLYWDDTPDPPSGLSIESGHTLRKSNDRLCVPPELLLASDDIENLADGYMFEEESYDLMHYESEMIKEFRNCETVEEMYTLADRIIGFFEEIDEAEDQEQEQEQEEIAPATKVKIEV